MPYAFFFALFFLPYTLFSQELSNVGKSPLLQVNGGLSLNQVFNWSDLPGSYRQPYAYTLAANMNFAVYGWSVPLSLMYSNKRWSYQQPFNQFSINPSYKWIKLYIGYNSMSFSNYTLNGHRFLGGGVEVTPSGNWKFSAMGGQMQKRILPDSAGNIQPAFERFGSGFKAEYSFKSGNVALSTFYGKDDSKSLAGYDSLEVTPAENLALALSGNVSILTRLNLNMEYSSSFFTEDTRSLRAENQYDLMPVYKRRTSTFMYNAIKSNLGYNSSYGTIGVGYERVDPGYRTLGSYTTVNDFENYTVNYAGQIIAEKLNLAASLGLQHDNLEKNKAQKNNRRVGSLNLAFTPVKIVSANFTYGNFRNYTHVKSGFENINNTTPYQYADTLDYTQISENMGLSVSIAPEGNEKVRRSFIVSTNYQVATEQQSDNLNHSKNRFYNAMAGYNHTFIKQGLSLATSVNYNRNKADSIITETIGPCLSTRKSFFEKKLNVSLSLSYNQSLMNGRGQSEVFIARNSIGYTLKENHSFDFGAVYANRHSMTKSTKTNDITLTLTYRYHFKGKTFDFKKKGQ